MKESNSNKTKNPNTIKYSQIIWYIILVILFSIFVFSEFKPKINFNELDRGKIKYVNY